MRAELWQRWALGRALTATVIPVDRLGHSPQLSAERSPDLLKTGHLTVVPATPSARLLWPQQPESIAKDRTFPLRSPEM